MLKKKTGFAWNLHTPEAEYPKGVFQNQPPTSDVNFWISQSRVNMSETENDTAFETNFQIYSVQVTGKCICETSPSFA